MKRIMAIDLIPKYKVAESSAFISPKPNNLYKVIFNTLNKEYAFWPYSLTGILIFAGIYIKNEKALAMNITNEIMPDILLLFRAPNKINVPVKK